MKPTREILKPRPTRLRRDSIFISPHPSHSSHLALTNGGNDAKKVFPPIPIRKRLRDGRVIRDQRRLAFQPCRSCFRASISCWVGSNSKKCASCVEKGKLKTECLVNRDNCALVGEVHRASSVSKYHSIYHHRLIIPQTHIAQ